MKTSNPLYNAVWRWHFYAGIFVIPFVIILATTGGIYIFKPQIERWSHPEFFKVKPAEKRLPYGEQLAAALKAFPNSRAFEFHPTFESEDSAEVRLRKENGQILSVFVNPYSGKVLGHYEDDSRLSAFVFKLHGGRLGGKWNEYLVELVASWTLVMLLTGLCLWWPKGDGSYEGVFYFRFNDKSRPTWRNIHAVSGFYLSILLGFWLLSGLPWTNVSGGVISKVSAFFKAGSPPGIFAPIYKSTPTEGKGPIALDQVMEVANKSDLKVSFFIKLPRGEKGVYSIFSKHRFPSEVTFIHIDQYSGKFLLEVRPDDMGVIAKAVTFGVRLHEGQLGLWNQFLGLFVCLSFIGMSITGATMWWKRKPPGQLGAPILLNPVSIPSVIIGAAVVLGCLMPLMGGSLAVVLLWDKLLAPHLLRT
jgi:uncharacterized iron-regulated membrane protein